MSCSPKTTLLKIETVFAGKIFVAISAVFNFVSILTSLHHPSNINLRIKWCFVFICLNLDWLTFRFWALCQILYTIVPVSSCIIIHYYYVIVLHYYRTVRLRIFYYLVPVSRIWITSMKFLSTAL